MFKLTNNVFYTPDEVAELEALKQHNQDMADEVARTIDASIAAGETP